MMSCIAMTPVFHSDILELIAVFCMKFCKDCSIFELGPYLEAIFTISSAISLPNIEGLRAQVA